jgi:hypothetical protein
VHRVLLQIGRQGMANWSAQRIGQISSTLGRELTRLGVPPHENASALAGVTDALLRLLEDPRGRWLYGDGQRDAEGEVALSAVLDGTLVNLVLDRTFVDAAGRRWIVDFKTSRHQGGELDRFLDSETERYRGQLETYARVWQMREPGEVWLGLYFPLLRAWREWKSE